ncbi:TRAF3-interacting protein 1 isoform X5 [Numida meleagris]|uniref:TRAF3-interacting protein 1 isoform X5 n=1 Tax=Numida meleagris TaxID=8996 RepID=UPI000B3D89F5|nr:TRAF3-interacting protein 1 isoform X5 [Numida meleagris]
MLAAGGGGGGGGGPGPAVAMNEAVVRRTQECLGQVIRKPPLTDRLLSKPPFRYLHDVITEVIRVTGFMKGLYTDFELKSDNVKDKDAKISFLQKAIDAVVMVTGEPLSVKPARVVAGHEPEKTNEFLQAIGKCCLNKLSSDAAVKKILAGERADAKGKPPSSKPRDIESKESKTEDHKNRRDKEGRGDTDVKDRSSSRDRKPKGDIKESEKRETESEKQKNNEDRHKDSERDNFKDGEKQEKERNKSRITKHGRETEKNKGKRHIEREDNVECDKVQEREKKNEGGRETDRLKERDKDKAREREREKDREKGKDRERDRHRDRGKDKEHVQEHGKDKAEKKSESPAGISRQSSTNGSRQRAKPGGEEEGAENLDPEKPAVSENDEVPSDIPPQAIQRRIPRPSSARPAPPRVVKRQESMETLLPERNGNGKAVSNVITERQAFGDDDDQFVVEAALPVPEVPKLEMEPEVDLVEDEKHGGLVKRILETKKDYEASQKSSKTTEKEKSFVSEAARKKERDLVAKEIEKFQDSIQTLCRSAFTLGRIMDYVQEDMDAMKNELQMWRHENRQHAEALQKEQSITDSAVEPLKAELAELDQLIEDQQDKIRAVKANILKNEEKIRRMVLSINLSSRR